MDRDRQIELMTTAKERMERRVRDWIQDPEINAALRRRPADDRHPDNDHVAPRDEPRRAACG